MKEAKTRIPEIIVVEGLHDRQAVEAALDADVFVTGGDRVSARLMEELARASRNRGVIVLTDPDGPGGRIRRRIDDKIPGCKHAFIPRDKAIGRHGLGVENASPDAIRQAVAEARQSHVEPALYLADLVGLSQGGAPSALGTFTMDDLQEHGLAGTDSAAERRRLVGESLRIGYANAKGFLRKLNALGVSREEWYEATQRLANGKGDDDERPT